MKAPLIGPYLRDGNWFPEPDYRAGLVQAEATKPAGRPIPEPLVATSTEASARLDDVLGETWTVIARPGALARTARERAEWAAHGAPTFELIDGEPSRDTEIADRDGRLTGFMDEHRVDALVLRPDHFVYAAARAGEPLAPPPALLNPNREIALQEQS